eukprot:12670369-Alexandrium_andersonii.AAC.1
MRAVPRSRSAIALAVESPEKGTHRCPGSDLDPWQPAVQCRAPALCQVASVPGVKRPRCLASGGLTLFVWRRSPLPGGFRDLHLYLQEFVQVCVA